MIKEKIKLPNFGELGIDIKEYLWKNLPSSFSEFDSKFSHTFKTYMIKWMHTKEIDLDLYPQYKHILMYMTFINFRKELQLANLLNKANFKIKATSSFVDMKYKVDLYGTNPNNELIFIQVKPHDNHNNEYDLTNLLEYSKKHSATPYIAFKQNQQWKIKKLNTNKKTA
ncbi:hypothetical protein [Mycoplasma sp. 21DD0573]|uniref:hypothetical protein n=1 Tax=unclassified Mycoplasma TaxID=2683645 RepID=UPI002B1E1BD0|nr:hypothetical protein [Mycoplasma sp. 21DD0573]MEA4276174.1 hypothetical protein [Mycoplasma sp. 21DD0573]